MPEETPDLKPTDLRGILRYVPMWREHVFVIALDGSIVEEENFANLVLDLAVLRSLHIKIVLTHGISHQLLRLGQMRDVALTDQRGEGPTDEATLELAIEAAAAVSHQIMRGLTANGLKCALSNAVRATEVGVLKGVDQLCAGKVEKVDAALLKSLLAQEVVPVLSPVAFSKSGASLRLNSDHLASELALALGASKLIFLAPERGLQLEGELVLNVPVEEVRQRLEKNPEAVTESLRSKARQAVKTIAGGTPRVHLLDGRNPDSLLAEIFSQVGVGTMIYGNEYLQVRRARKEDAVAIAQVTREGARDASLKPRSGVEVEEAIDDYVVYEIDGTVVGCACLVPYPEEGMVEIAAVSVLPFYQHRGVGRKLVSFALREAKREGYAEAFALTTQSYGFFRRVIGFRDGEASALPARRQEELAASGRNSKVLQYSL